MKHLETKLQESCITWFDYAYPKYRQLLFAIPNAGGYVGNFKSNMLRVMAMKRQGVRKGVPDLFLSVPRMDSEAGVTWHGYYIEMKAGKNKLSGEQVEFARRVDAMAYKFSVCTTFDQFKKLIEQYLGNVQASAHKIH